MGQRAALRRRTGGWSGHPQSPSLNYGNPFVGGKQHLTWTFFCITRTPFLLRPHVPVAGVVGGSWGLTVESKHFTLPLGIALGNMERTSLRPLLLRHCLPSSSGRSGVVWMSCQAISVSFLFSLQPSQSPSITPYCSRTPLQVTLTSPRPWTTTAGASALGCSFSPTPLHYSFWCISASTWMILLISWILSFSIP